MKTLSIIEEKLKDLKLRAIIGYSKGRNSQHQNKFYFIEILSTATQLKERFYINDGEVRGVEKILKRRDCLIQEEKEKKKMQKIERGENHAEEIGEIGDENTDPIDKIEVEEIEEIKEAKKVEEELDDESDDL